MSDLPRSRAIVAFDRNGYLLPIEPVTPANSKAWRVVHLSPVLIAVGVGLFLVAAFAGQLVALALRQFGFGMRGLYTVPVIGAAVVVVSYLLFVRFVERRRDVPELAFAGSWWEAAAGAVIAALVYAGIVAVIVMLGAGGLVHIGRTVAMPILVFAACGAIVQEIIMRGEIFRLIERLAGSMIALAATGLIIGVIQLVYVGSDPLMSLAIALENGMLFSAIFMVTRRLWAPFAAHIVWSSLPLMTTLELHGADAVTGGANSALAGWPAVVVTGLAIAALVAFAASRSRIVAPAWTRDVVRPKRGRARRAELGRG